LFVVVTAFLSSWKYFAVSMKAGMIASVLSVIAALVFLVVVEFVAHSCSIRSLLSAMTGFLFGLVIGHLVCSGLDVQLSAIEASGLLWIRPVIYNVFGFSLLIVFLINNEDIGLFDYILPSAVDNAEGGISYKILDTSVIIDGRVADICDTGFIEGILVIPNFVLHELQMIADSADSIKRNRGRRGLDILNKMQKDQSIKVKISDIDFPDVAEVDSKLVKLAKVMKAKIVTNDFNLNKVAEFHGVPVLNINQLSNALKPIVLPGEDMHLSLIKEGKDINQAVGYLDDGTMVVVENGRRKMNHEVDVVVTSVLQTTAGRMIFARLKEV
jgi:uncharacterized protein YacL